MTNWQEFLAGTHPNDPDSRLKLNALVTPNGLALEFSTVSNRSYSILFNSAPDPGNWNVLTNFPAHSANQIITVPIEPAAAAGRFYRVVTPAQP
jgi:hypothetical protein